VPRWGWALVGALGAITVAIIVVSRHNAEQDAQREAWRNSGITSMTVNPNLTPEQFRERLPASLESEGVDASIEHDRSLVTIYANGKCDAARDAVTRVGLPPGYVAMCFNSREDSMARVAWELR
jgi:hypothetical protein